MLEICNHQRNIETRNKNYSISFLQSVQSQNNKIQVLT